MNTTRRSLAAAAALVAVALGALATTAVDHAVTANKNGHSVTHTVTANRNGHSLVPTASR